MVLVKTANGYINQPTKATQNVGAAGTEAQNAETHKKAVESSTNKLQEVRDEVKKSGGDSDAMNKLDQENNWNKISKDKKDELIRGAEYAVSLPAAVAGLGNLGMKAGANAIKEAATEQALKEGFKSAAEKKAAEIAAKKGGSEAATAGATAGASKAADVVNTAKESKSSTTKTPKTKTDKKSMISDFLTSFGNGLQGSSSIGSNNASGVNQYTGQTLDNDTSTQSGNVTPNTTGTPEVQNYNNTGANVTQGSEGKENYTDDMRAQQQNESEQGAYRRSQSNWNNGSLY
jgi:hypothetical protein